MMKANYILSLLFVLLCLSCDDGIVDPDPGGLPEADFIFQIQTNDPKSVSFASTSSGQNSIVWDFGDGTRSTSEAAAKTYAENGTYQVSLTAVNIAGVNTMIKEVVIDGPNKPEAGFEVSFDDVASSLQVNLVNTSLFADEVEWDFGDGNSSTDPDLTSHTYTLPGTYTIRLVATSNDERLSDRDRSNTIRIDVSVLDDSFLYGTVSRTWIFKEDSIVRNFTFNMGQENEFSQDTLVSAYHVLRADSLFFEVPVEDCMLDDHYTFSSSGDYLTRNNGDGRLIEFGGQCGSVSEPGETNWQIDRNADEEFILTLVNSYIGDSEVGFFFKIIELTNDLLLVEVETASPVSEEVRTVVMAFEPI